MIKELLVKRLKQTIIIAIGLIIITFLPGCSKQNQHPNQTKDTKSINVETSPTDTKSNSVETTPTDSKSNSVETTPTVTKSNSLDTTPIITESIENKNELFVNTDNENNGVLIYMGSGLSKEELGKRKKLISDKYLLETQGKKEEEFPLYDCAGQEMFCILPHYLGSTITVNRAEISDDGKLVEKEKLVTSDKPIFIQCNESDLHSNVIITIKHNDDSTSFSPYISLMDGSVMPVAQIEVIYLTKE